LIIRLEPARSERFTWEERLDLRPAELGLPELRALAPVEVAGTLAPAAPNFVLEARLRYRLTVACDRCTRPVEQPIESTFRLVVVPSAKRRRDGVEVELREDELGIVEIAGETIDTRPLIVEQVLLDLPVHPLCRAECAGLCPTCGADLNLGPCGCEKIDVDPRWGAALAELKGKLDGGA